MYAGSWGCADWSPDGRSVPYRLSGYIPNSFVAGEVVYASPSSVNIISTRQQLLDTGSYIGVRIIGVVVSQELLVCKGAVIDPLS